MGAGFIWKLGSVGFPDRLNEECKRKNRVKDDSRTFDLSN